MFSLACRARGYGFRAEGMGLKVYKVEGFGLHEASWVALSRLEVH